MAIWRGVRFSSTFNERVREAKSELDDVKKTQRATHILHHGEDDTKLSLGTDSDDDTGSVACQESTRGGTSQNLS